METVWLEKKTIFFTSLTPLTNHCYYKFPKKTNTTQQPLLLHISKKQPQKTASKNEHKPKKIPATIFLQVSGEDLKPVRL